MSRRSTVILGGEASPRSAPPLISASARRRAGIRWPQIRFRSEIRQPLGYAIVGGLLVSQRLTLFTTPVVYLAMARPDAALSPARGTVEDPPDRPVVDGAPRPVAEMVASRAD